MLLTLPIEMLDHAVSLLDGDVTSLGACSLTCRALLPICRVYLWRHVELRVGYSSPFRFGETVAFLELLQDNLAIPHCVKSLALRQAAIGDYDFKFLPEDRISWRVLLGRFPSLRTLRMRNFGADCLYDLVSIAGECPTLEALYLNMPWIDDRYGILAPPRPVWPTTRARPSAGAKHSQSTQWGLRTLSVVNAIVPCSELSQLVSFLEQSTDYICLESLDLKWRVPYAGTYQDPRFLIRPGLPAFGATLRHFAITFNDVGGEFAIVPEGRAHIRRVLSALHTCRSLRSLCIDYDDITSLSITTFQLMRRPYAWGHTPAPFFLELLADTLFASPLLLLERLSLDFKCPAHWLVAYGAAFARLADALVGNAPTGVARGHPLFSRLDVRTTFASDTESVWDNDGMEEYRAKQSVERETLLLPMFDRFVRAGVHVEVVCD